MTQVITRQPAEWGRHAAVWTAWPTPAAGWGDALDAARTQVAALIHAIDDGGRGEQVELIVADDASVADAEAEAAIAGSRARIHRISADDIWLRDTAPIFVFEKEALVARDFRFNGWGGKYACQADCGVAEAVAHIEGIPVRACDWVLEGGGIDVDGEGLAVVTEQCLMNPNRNPGLSRRDIERRLAENLGVERVLWLGEGLANDHTDGHVDNLARFVGPSRLALPVAAGADDPNAQVFADARERAAMFGVEVVDMPSSGRFELDGVLAPASYMNFYVANNSVVVPLYGVANDGAAVERIGGLFPDRKAVGLRAEHLLRGGGSFHCITQQVPALPGRD